jgi:hypothetical protein
MKNVKVFCCKCGKEVWEDVSEIDQKYKTLFEANNFECSDCLLDRLHLEHLEYLNSFFSIIPFYLQLR